MAVPDPGVVFPPGLLVSVQAPVAGKLPSTTLPEGIAQVGCIMFPTTGEAGSTQVDTARMAFALFPQLFCARTPTVPPVVPKLTVMLVVP